MLTKSENKSWIIILIIICLCSVLLYSAVYIYGSSHNENNNCEHYMHIMQKRIIENVKMLNPEERIKPFLYNEEDLKPFIREDIISKKGYHNIISNDTTKKMGHFYPRLTKENANAFLLAMDKVAEVLNKANLSYHMCGGTLLGSYRFHGFIPWDLSLIHI